MSRNMFATIGPPHSSGPTREEIQLEQVRRAAWPRLEVTDLHFRRHFVEHLPTADLYFAHRGEIEDSVYTSAAAYYMTDGGELRFLQKPGPGLPQTRAELEQRRTPKPPPPRQARRRTVKTWEATIKFAPLLTVERVNDPEWQDPERSMVTEQTFRFPHKQTSIPFVSDHNPDIELGTVREWFRLKWIDGPWLAARPQPSTRPLPRSYNAEPEPRSDTSRSPAAPPSSAGRKVR